MTTEAVDSATGCLTLDGQKKFPRAYRHALDRITAWRAEVFRDRILMKPTTIPADSSDLNDLQREMLATKTKLRARGLPEGQP